MAELKCKIRGLTGSSIRQNIYFTCHPKDFELYFESISEEILRVQDCAIYYYDPDDEPERDEAYYMNLSQMRMIAIPVTRRFLEEDSRALWELRYAAEHHIAVLPLIHESGLEKLFAVKCGDLHFLGRDQDEIAVSYQEKLERFIKSVLVGGELAKKIREEFDAYIFLSYRKKDLKYAQELMRLIHNDELLRDIAIWYDEFLIPGENFTDAIRDALIKSELFVLAITPSIVEDGNYVLREEYPLAKSEKKLILPAELIPTDRNELMRKFDELPDCTDAYNSSALSGALRQALNRFVLQKNDSDPQHIYLIGCAYLNGIDMEKDVEKALALITEAAETGYEEAMIKLADMYYSGDGVARDYDAGIQWSGRAVEQAQKTYEQSGKFQDGVNYLKRLEHLYANWDKYEEKTFVRH